jgi:hypothetical protein
LSAEDDDDRTSATRSPRRNPDWPCRATIRARALHKRAVPSMIVAEVDDWVARKRECKAIIHFGCRRRAGDGRHFMTARMADEELGLLPGLGTPFHTIHLQVKQHCVKHIVMGSIILSGGTERGSILGSTHGLAISRITRRAARQKTYHCHVISGRIAILYSADEQLRP